MPFELNKTESEARSELVAELELATVPLMAAIDTANEAIGKLLLPLNQAVDDYNAVLEKVCDLVESVTNRMQAQFDKRGDRWKDGNVGTAVIEFIAQWTDLDFTELDHFEIDLFDEIDVEHRDLLENAPEEIDP